MGKADKFKNTIQAPKISHNQLSTVLGRASDGNKQQSRQRDRNSALIGLHLITTNPQVRQTFAKDKLQELAHSLQTLGLQQPVTVYYDEQRDKYVIVHGERRYRAAKSLGWKDIPARVLQAKPSEDERIELQWAENAMREDLNPMELARALKQLQALRGYSTRDLVNRVGKTQSTITRLLSLLKLPDDVQDLVANGQIPASVASRTIVRYKTAKLQRQKAKEYIAGSLTSEDSDRVARPKKTQDSQPPAKRTKQWDARGVSIKVSCSHGITNANIAMALREAADELLASAKDKAA